MADTVEGKGPIVHRYIGSQRGAATLGGPFKSLQRLNSTLCPDQARYITPFIRD